MAALVLGFHFERGLQQHREEELRGRAIEVAALVRSRIEQTFNERLRYLETLKAFCMAKPDIDQGAMERLAGWILDGRPEIRTLSLAPKAVVRMFVPLAGNEPAIGHDLLADPLRRDAVRAAIETRSVTTQGPVSLKQGGTGLIARDPVFLPGAEGRPEEFWGLAVIVFDFDALYRQAIPQEASQIFDIALRHGGADRPAGETFVGESRTFDHALSVADIRMPGASWQVGLVPKSGWSPPSPTRTVVYAGSFLVGMMLATLLFKMQMELERRQLAETHLRKAVADAEAREIRLSSILETVGEGIMIVDEGESIIEANSACFEMFRTTRSRLVGSNIREWIVLSPDTHLNDFGPNGVDAEARRPGEPPFTAELVMGRIDASVSWTGGVLYTVVVRDITDRVRSERDRVQMLERLSESSKFESLGTLAGGIAHEINTPTQYVGDNLRFLQDG
ncbi:MAG: CHASE domain-containing protein, partial [Rhodospirillales bacterium]|nr:CHASE domain-containing protein [Rhodospirillales bacterium]